MEWETKIYKTGDTRERTGFLFLPKDIVENGFCVTKWLKTATWTEKYEASWGDNYWYPIEWVK